MSDIEVHCHEAGDGWRCAVTVSDPAGSSTYDVLVPAGPLPATLGPDPTVDDMERLVRETFGFLLEREPRSSILARFELAVVERYFPEYPAEIRRRLAR